MKAKEAKEISKKVNEEYENNCKIFSFVEDVESFKSFLMKTIENNSKVGCTSFEFETKNDLSKTDIIDYFKEEGYKVNFYKLNSEYCNEGYCLLISW